MLSGAAANYSALTETQRGIAVCCRVGQSWLWDGVDFLVLQPAESSADRSASGNANSCVLKASLGKRSILLSGDIERAQELEIHVGDDRWQADVLIAPHHGSATSSSFPLLKRVKPGRAVVSAAHNNAFGHPHFRVIKRYELLAIDHISTASAGMVSLVLDDANSAWRVENFRKSEQRYWMPR
jgi:competence protein ComEC